MLAAVLRYRFDDYWKLSPPLLIIIVFGMPSIAWFWPQVGC